LIFLTGVQLQMRNKKNAALDRPDPQMCHLKNRSKLGKRSLRSKEGKELAAEIAAIKYFNDYKLVHKRIEAEV
jgi:hypothetical protein